MTDSRSRRAWVNGVEAPMSVAMLPMAMKWLEMRHSSPAMARMYCARGGTSTPSSRSTARA